MCRCWSFLELQCVNLAFPAYFVAKGLVVSSINLPQRFFFVKVACDIDEGDLQHLFNLF